MSCRTDSVQGHTKTATFSRTDIDSTSRPFPFNLAESAGIAVTFGFVSAVSDSAMTSNELKLAIEHEYQRLRRLLFPPHISTEETQLLLISEEDVRKNTPNLVSAYRRPPKDSITVAIPESSLNDLFAIQGSPLFGTEPIWKADPLHEVIHEFQFKCVGKLLAQASI
jgi:hypothetical protein